MDLRLTMLKATSFYLLYNVSSLNQCRKLAQLCVNTLPVPRLCKLQMGFNLVR
jgi:hypothetical protein